LDVLSYVGGILPALFYLFVFLKYYAFYYFEMGFARKHFKVAESRYHNFAQFVKFSLHNALRVVGCQPERWKIAECERRLSETVRRQLDISYLFRRIELLERGLSVLLDKHQLKGLCLAHTSVREADDHHRRLSLRDRMVRFLNKEHERRASKQGEGSD
jgi:hypothetical protein